MRSKCHVSNNFCSGLFFSHETGKANKSERRVFDENIWICLVCVLLSYVYLLYCVGSAFFFFTLDAGLLARSQYSEGPATGHLDTGFSWFACT